MSLRVVKVPDIGEGIAEVELVEWHVAQGDVVAADQTLADVMTDKATVEVPSPVAGRVLSLGGRAGDKLAVGSELLRLDSGDALAAGDAAVEPALDAAGAASLPRAAVPAPPAPAPRVDKPLASPSVRHHARQLGIELGDVAGSGPDGRVVHEDLVRHAGRGAAARADDERYAQRSGEVSVPVIGLRRQIAMRMQDSLRIPHFTYVEEIDVTELEALRARLNAERGATRGHLTVLPFVMRAIVLALPSFPEMNAHFDDAKGVVLRYAPVHIGIATQAANGLLVPVVRHAESRDLWASAAEVTRLAQAARAGKATRSELGGSTITVTSLGPLGGIVTTPVINPPEVAIIGVNRIVLRPAVREGAIVQSKHMNLSSSFDHRVVDGARAAQFVQALRGYLECPAMLFID